MPLSEEKYQLLEQKRLSAMKGTATKIGVTGTPLFIINSLARCRGRTFRRSKNCWAAINKASSG
ncbi:MAG: hypothetical protein NTZ57_03350 [Deltaproteobacteria bacterium]|nr:hypothetical protein [Deltaproteobacteria bacterium]